LTIFYWKTWKCRNLNQAVGTRDNIRELTTNWEMFEEGLERKTVIANFVFKARLHLSGFHFSSAFCLDFYLIILIIVKFFMQLLFIKAYFIKFIKLILLPGCFLKTSIDIMLLTLLLCVYIAIFLTCIIFYLPVFYHF